MCCCLCVVQKYQHRSANGYAITASAGGNRTPALAKSGISPGSMQQGFKNKVRLCCYDFFGPRTSYLAVSKQETLEELCDRVSCTSRPALGGPGPPTTPVSPKLPGEESRKRTRLRRPAHGHTCRHGHTRSWAVLRLRLGVSFLPSCPRGKGCAARVPILVAGSCSSLPVDACAHVVTPSCAGALAAPFPRWEALAPEATRFLAMSGRDRRRATCMGFAGAQAPCARLAKVARTATLHNPAAARLPRARPGHRHVGVTWRASRPPGGAAPAG